MTPRMKTLLLILGALLLLATVWSGNQFWRRRAAAANARASLEACLHMAAEIEHFRSRPMLAAEHEQLESETTGFIEHSARDAGIAADCLSRITPEPPQRIGDTVYKEKPTQVLLRKVNLEQLVKFLYNLVGTHAGLQSRSIRLSAPRGESGEGEGSWWTAEVVLTYLIYDPPRVGR